MINPRTGHLLCAPSQCVRAGDSVEAVLALGLGEANDVNDVHTGWSWLRVPNVRVGNDSLSLVFGFHHNRLQMVLLDVLPALVGTASTEAAWSEQAALQRLPALQHWVRSEVGREGQFPWGSITADYDFKNVTSGITIRYA